MSQIEISCVGSTAVFTNTPDIFSGGNVDEVKFEFDKEWGNFKLKTAVFYTNPKETALQILDTNNVTKIPPNMLAKKSKLSIGVIGTDTNGNVKTSKILTYIVNQGAVTDDMETTTPTPDIWLQMLSIVEQNKQTVEQNKQLINNMDLFVNESQLPNKANKDLSNVSVDDLANKGMIQMITGSYVGTGTVGSSNGYYQIKQKISFDVTPKFVLVFPYPVRDDYSNNTVEYAVYTGFATPTISQNGGNHSDNSQNNLVKIVDGGFEVCYGVQMSSSGIRKMACTNENGVTYGYIALI